MQARDVMQTNVVTVMPEMPVREIAEQLLANRISAVPVVDEQGRVVGIVSEGDLMRRPESGTERHPSWWLRLFASPEERAITYVKSHGGHARDVMTQPVVSVGEDASLEEIAELLEKQHIKRVPVLREGKLCGIVSRADLLRGLVARQAAPAVSAGDQTLKDAVEKALAETGVRSFLLSVVVAGGVVHLWGATESEAEKRAARVAAEGVPGVTSVRDEIRVLPAAVRSVMWAQ